MTTSIKQEWYPNGQLKEEIHYNGSQLANGWSYQSFFPNGHSQQQQCYSHNQLIEQKTFNENGDLLTHTIWNHRLQQMVDRPVVTPASQTLRPNVASGCLTIYSIIEILPWVCEIIDAPVQSTELLAAHNLFYGDTDDEEENEDEEVKEEEYWVLEGKKGRLSVIFERSEGYLFYHIRTPDINDYEKARHLVDRVQNRISLRVYNNEETLQKKAANTATPILHYLADSSNQHWLEFEVNVWGTEPIYSVLEKSFTMSSHWIEMDTYNIHPANRFLESLPDWDNIIKEVMEAESAFYIIQYSDTTSIPILKNPSPLELEKFLNKHKYSH